MRAKDIDVGKRIREVVRNSLCQAWNEASEGKDSVPYLDNIIDKAEETLLVLSDFAGARAIWEELENLDASEDWVNRRFRNLNLEMKDYINQLTKGD